MNNHILRFFFLKKMRFEKYVRMYMIKSNVGMLNSEHFSVSIMYCNLQLITLSPKCFALGGPGPTSKAHMVKMFWAY